MSEFYDCRLIRDLLPSHNDKLLSGYSKKIVDEHLESCKECKSYFLGMNSEEIPQGSKENLQEANGLRGFLIRIVLRNILIGSLLATMILSIAVVSTWGWYKSEYLAENVVLPAEHVRVIDTRDNGDGTIYVKLAAETDYKVGAWKLMEDKNDASVFILQMYHAKKADTMTENERAQYDGYSFILEATIAVDTSNHRENADTGTYPSRSGTVPQNSIAKKMVVYRGQDPNESIVLWEK